MDSELSAMHQVNETLKNFEKEAKTRILKWIADRNSLEEIQKILTPQLNLPEQTQNNINRNFESFSELFNAANPQTNEDKILVAAYWLQEIQKKPITTRPLNNELKLIGHWIKANIDINYDNLLKLKPSPLILLKKEGKTRQAIKIYKLTDVGKSKVLSLINSET